MESWWNVVLRVKIQWVMDEWWFEWLILIRKWVKNEEILERNGWELFTRERWWSNNEEQVKKWWLESI